MDPYERWILHENGKQYKNLPSDALDDHGRRSAPLPQIPTNPTPYPDTLMYGI